MVDKISKEKRSEIMSKIRAKDTKPELLVRKYLFSKGYRYRKNDKRLPGTPDIYLPKYKTVIFINGCFWHGHKNCKYYKLPKSNTAFWQNKIDKNNLRDQAKTKELESLGLKVIIVWECQINDNFEETMTALLSQLETK